MFKKYQQWPALAVLVAAIASTFVDGMPPTIVLVLLIISAVLFIISSRGSKYFNKAQRIIAARDLSRYPEAIGYLEKAIKAGMPDSYLVIAASVLMQYGDMEKARQALVPLLESKDKQTAALAKITLSLYWFANDDLERAIELCESARDENGSTDRNLCFNLAVYYLRAGRRKDFRKCVKDALTRYPSSPAISDMQAVLFMLDERWDLAGSMLYAIFDSTSPTSAEPYVHMAMTYLHYGMIEKAREELEKADAAHFTNISIYSSEDIEKLMKALEDPEEIMAAAAAVNSSTMATAAGIMPSWNRGEAASVLSVLPGYPELPDFRSIAIQPKDDADEGRSDVNTELTEADEKWLKRHED